MLEISHLIVNMYLTLTCSCTVNDAFLFNFLGNSSKPMAVPGSSPVVVIDADEDSGFTASVDSKLANEYYLYKLVLTIISSWPPERL